MLRLAFDFIITWRETRTRPNAYKTDVNKSPKHNELSGIVKVVFMMIHHRSTQNLIMNRL